MVTRREDKDIRMVETYEDQLNLWHKGESCHVRVGSSYECCPDFSCCYPDCAHTYEVRDKFFRADKRNQNDMLSGFLQEFADKLQPSGKIKVIG